MKILVTGGAGFIGSHLAHKLLEEKHRVVLIDNLHTGLEENVPARVKLLKIDVRDKRLAEIFFQENFDAVVHLAAQTMVNRSVDAPLFDADINIIGGLNVLEASRRAKVQRVLFSSSAAVYGDVKTVPIKEDFEKIPTSFYGLSKLTFEYYLELYRKNFGLDYIVLRFANVYGERQGDGGEGGVISIFAKKIAEGEAIDIFGDGRQTRDFIYAGDIASAICQALTADKVNTVYNLSNKQETSINQLVEIFSQISGRPVPHNYKPPRPGDIYRSVLDNARAVSHLHWQSVTPLEEGLEKTYQYFLKK
jgi:UDP-glucose 4-epimerase